VSTELTCLDATQLASKIRSKAISPVEVAQAHLQRIEAMNPRLNAIVTPNPFFMDEARAAEEAVMSGIALGPLHGVPFTIKDCIDTRGLRTTRGSKLFSNHVPTADATVVTRLRRAGGIFIGKTNMPEFALWWETDNVVFGRTVNPWNHERTPGGSSGGEAAAIVSGMSPLGMGSDLGGSIREPANYCGIIGLKPTHGRVPLTGHWPDTLLRFMHVGPLARSVRDIALSLSVVAGPDGRDPYAIPVESYKPTKPTPDLAGMRVGWTTDGPFAPAASSVKKVVASAANALAELGCTVEEVALDSMIREDPQRISDAVYATEGRHYLDPLIRGREHELAPSMQRRLGLPLPTQQDYLDAVESLERLKAGFLTLWDRHDLLLCSAGLVPAHPHDQNPLVVEGQQMAGRNALRATIPFDLTGSPAISVPFGWSTDGLPIGVQLVGRHFDEDTVLRAAAALETLHGQPCKRLNLNGSHSRAS